MVDLKIIIKSELFEKCYMFGGEKSILIIEPDESSILQIGIKNIDFFWSILPPRELEVSS